MVIALLVPAVAAGCGSTSKAQQAYEKAQSLEEEGMLTKAIAEYERARGLYEKEGKSAEALNSRDAAQSAMFVQLSYSDTKADLEKKLAEMYPKVPEKTRNEWITSGEVEHMEWDGKVHYFSQAAENIATRHFEIAYQNEEKAGTIAEMVRNISSTCGGSAPPWQPYSNPITWLGTESINVPRSELPETGVLKLWFPLPVQLGGPQDSVSLVSVTPDTYLKQPPSIDQSLSDAYFEVPLDELAEDLAITVQFQFTHYQTNFKIDPENVGEYDKGIALYKEYTKSYGNTSITPEIEETAKKVVDGEKNPYLAAKKLYDYIIDDIKYSLMPHTALWPRGEPESEYVHRLKRGDCGAQSIYFSALCRSLGIPARTTGGWQLFTGNFSGHFWAEFYLPNYGWVPVDPTAADIADWTDKLTDEEKRQWKEFYFGNQDPLRCNVQANVDEPTVPPLDGEILLPLAIQQVQGTCSEMEEPVGLLLLDYQTISAEQIAGEKIPLASGPVH